MGCRNRLENDLLNLPTLYSDCNAVAGRGGMRVIRKAPRKSAATDSLNPAAVEIRSTIRTVLASWAALIAEERRLAGPDRDIPELTRFLVRNVDWLTGHPAVSDLADEVRELVRIARNVAYPDNTRRMHIGSCPGTDCDGELVALIRHHDDIHPSKIVCTSSAAHSWPITWWNRLARQMRSREGQLQNLGEGA